VAPGGRSDASPGRGGAGPGVPPQALSAVSELVDYASDAAFGVDGNLRIIGWNRTAEGLLGYTPAETLGRPCGDVLQAVLASGEPLCGPGCPGAACFRCARPFSANACRARHRDGGWVSVSLGTLVVPWSDGDPKSGPAGAVVLLRPRFPLEAAAPGGARSELVCGLRIFTLGHFGLAIGDRGVALEGWARRQAVSLLQYLVAHVGRDVHRERLVELLWPEEGDARRAAGRLKVTVYALRRELRRAGLGEEAIATVGHAYVLRREVAWVDADAFERRVIEGTSHERRGRRAEALRCYEDARRLFRGDYLEEALYADWCAEERERLRELYLDLLARMACGYAAKGDYAKAAEACRAGLASEPCREGFHRALIEYLARLGRIDSAIAQFRHCQRTLARELGLEPSPETRRLHRHLVKAGAGALPPGPGGLVRR